MGREQAQGQVRGSVFVMDVWVEMGKYFLRKYTYAEWVVPRRQGVCSVRVMNLYLDGFADL